MLLYSTYASFFKTQFENSNDVTPSVNKYEQIMLSYIISVKYSVFISQVFEFFRTSEKAYILPFCAKIACEVVKLKYFPSI